MEEVSQTVGYVDVPTVRSVNLLDVTFKALGEHSVHFVDYNVLHLAKMEMALKSDISNE